MSARPKEHPETAVRRVDGTPIPRSGTYRRAPPNGSLASYRQEHESIRGWVAKIRDADPASLSVALLGFRSALLLHFANEEGQEGLFALLSERRGQDHVVETLRSQHHEMLTQIRRLQSMIDNQRPRLSEDAAELRDGLVDLVTGHERRESALLQDLMLTDLGDGF